MNTPTTLEAESSVEKAFPTGNEFQTEDGARYTVNRWSVRKFTTMGKALSKLMTSALAIVTRERRTEYTEAVALAKESGMDEGDPHYPQAEQFDRASMQDMVAALPETIELAASELAHVVATSLSTREIEVTAEEILDRFTLDDLGTAMHIIIDVNFRKDTMGKWQGLLGKMMSSLT